MKWGFDPTIKIDKRAIFYKGAEISPYCKFWHLVPNIMGAKIGLNCTFRQNVYMGGNAPIGNNLKIQNNESIFERITLEDNVFCGLSMVFTNVINPRSAFPKKHAYKKS